MEAGTIFLITISNRRNIYTNKTKARILKIWEKVIIKVDLEKSQWLQYNDLKHLFNIKTDINYVCI